MTPSLATAALSYAARGWLVVPLHSVVAGRCTCGAVCKSPGKHPRTAHGLKDASRDPATVRAWWSRHPDANVGVVTGRASGIWAVDVDVKHDGEASIAKRDLPATLEFRTGSGGRHLIYATGDEQVKSGQSVLGPGVDTRGEGGYIVAPPSSNAKGEYSILADRPIVPYVCDEVRRPTVTAPPRPHPPAAASPMRERALGYIRSQVARLEQATAGERHNALLRTAKTCAGVLHYGVGADELRVFLLEACVANGSSGDKANERTIAAGVAEGSAAPMTLEDRQLPNVWRELPREAAAAAADDDGWVQLPAPRLLPSGAVVAGLLGPLKASASKFGLAIGKGEKVEAASEARAALAALLRDVAPLAHAVRDGGGVEFEASVVELATVLKTREIDTLRRAIREVPEERRVTTIDLAVAAESRVFGMLQRTGDEDGPPKSNRHNMALILEHDTRWRGRIRFNELQGAEYLDGRQLEDEHAYGLGRWIEQVYGLSVPTTTLREVIHLVARGDRYNPVTDYLDAVQWDEAPRIDRLLTAYFGVADSPLVQAIGRKWLIGCVARAYEPGCKLDTCMILVGKQGAMKSSAIRALVPEGEWFADTAINLGDKDRFQVLDGKWIYEIAEMDAWGKHEWSTIKAFVSSSHDNYRRSFGHYVQRTPRRTAFVGTTNGEEFLGDASGSRRFWPVRVGRLHPDSLTDDRDQLWAEAVLAYRAGERWWLTPEEEAELVVASAEFQAGDAWESRVLQWVNDAKFPFEVVEVAHHALNLKADQVSRIIEMRIANILRSNGWTRTRTRQAGGRVSLWWRG